MFPAAGQEWAGGKHAGIDRSPTTFKESTAWAEVPIGAQLQNEYTQFCQRGKGAHKVSCLLLGK